MPDREGKITPPPGLLPAPPRSPAAPPRANPRRPLVDSAVPEETRVVRRPASPATAVWWLRFEDGTELALAGATVVGRNPTPPPDARDSTALPLDDPRTSLSKTHALLVPQHDVLQVTDLHSTNGVAVVHADGSVTVARPGGSIAAGSGATLRLGNLAMTVHADTQRPGSAD